jgi:hypothetical protein
VHRAAASGAEGCRAVAQLQRAVQACIGHTLWISAPCICCTYQAQRLDQGDAEWAAAQGISKAATIRLLPGMGGNSKDEKQETQRDSTVEGEPSSIKALQISSAQATSHGSPAPSPSSALTYMRTQVSCVLIPNLTFAPIRIHIPPWVRSWRRVGQAGGGRFAAHRTSSSR